MSLNISASSYRRVFKDSTPTMSYTPLSSRLSLSGGRCPSSASPISSRSVGHKLRSSTPAPRMVYEKLDLSLVDATNQELLSSRSNEKAELQQLNDRFASFIEKVRYLEHQNAGLQTELVRHQNHQNQSRTSELCQRELQELRHQLDLVTKERDSVQIERDNLAEDLALIRCRLEEEAQKRTEAENNLVLFRKDVDDATLTCLGLERKIESLMDETEFLKKVHKEEIHDLQMSMQTQQLQPEAEGPARPDLTSALRDIRAQYESIATKNMQETEEWYKSKFADLTESAKRSMEALRQAKQDANDSRRQVQSLTCEIDALKNMNEALLRQRRDMENKVTVEAEGYQDTVSQLEEEIRQLKDEMSRHLCEYQDLLNIKMALDVEIATYRKLLEGEENRIAIPVHNFSSLSLRNADLDHLPDVYTRRTMLIKTTETLNGEVVKESRKERDD